MKQQKKTSQPQLSRWRYLAPIILGAAVVFIVVQQVSAGPITGGAGNAPFAKLSVYQGVISVVPGGAGDSVMEIGNAGRDIASTGSLYLRPGTLTGGGDVIIAPQNTANEGGEIALLGSATNPNWITDVFANRYRIFSSGGEIFTLTDAGNAGIGNFSPAGKLVVNNGSSGNGSKADGISAYANTRCVGGTKNGQICNWDTDCPDGLGGFGYTQCVGSAIYAEQANNNQQSGASGPTWTHDGYAGYFSGRVKVQPPGVSPWMVGPNEWSRYYSGTTMTIAGNIPFWNGETLDVYNQNIDGLAARIRGFVQIDAGTSYPRDGGDPGAALDVRNWGENSFRVGAINAKGPDNLTFSYGISASSGQPTAGGTGIGILARGGICTSCYDFEGISSSKFRAIKLGTLWSTQPPLDGLITPGNVGIGQPAPVARLVVNNYKNQPGTMLPTETGTGQDGIFSSVNTTGSAVYAKQADSTGYAGNFQGRVNIVGGLIDGTTISGALKHVSGTSGGSQLNVVSMSIADPGVTCTTACSSAVCMFGVRRTPVSFLDCSAVAPVGGTNCLCY